MRRRSGYSKANVFNADTMTVNLCGIKNETGNSDIDSVEIVEFAATLFRLASKRGRTKSISEEVLDEAI